MIASCDIGKVVIVGAGHAGGVVAAALRQNGFKGSITLLGDEPLAPYQRPPLSKKFLTSDLALDTFKLRPDSFYAEHGIELYLGERVLDVDRSQKTVTTQGGRVFHYDALILATGSRNLQLAVPGADLGRVHALRNVTEAGTLRATLADCRQLVVVGGGYIGLEVAASARSRGIDVTVVEREARLLSRVASPALAAFFDRYHRGQGVRILTGATVSGLEGDDNGAGNVGAVRLSDGRTLDCDAVLVGIGAQAEVDLAMRAGLACDNGVVVDGAGRTSDPAIFAIGDIARRPLAIYGDRRVRLESVPNAIEQAKQAAAAIAGTTPPPPELPWFWSDQYDLKLQIAGLLLDVDQTVMTGSEDGPEFVLYHFSNGILVAVEAVNAIRQFMAARKLVGDPGLDVAGLNGRVITSDLAGI